MIFKPVLGQNVSIKHLSIHDLIPDVTEYITYEGSLTIPSCQETVTWIIINKPIFITKQQVKVFL
jgi:carbonic anhydrase, putative